MVQRLAGISNSKSKKTSDKDKEIAVVVVETAETKRLERMSLATFATRRDTTRLDAGRNILTRFHIGFVSSR